MGIGLVLAAESSNVDAISAAVPDALVIGEVVRSEGEPRVRLE